MRKLDLRSVNWWDGMLVSKADFCEQERYHEESLRWLQRYGWALYGILPSLTDDSPALEISADLADDSQLRVNILHCHALTRDGAAVHIDAASPPQQAHPVVGLHKINPQPAQSIPVYIRPVAEKLPVGELSSTGNAGHRASSYEVIFGSDLVSDDGTTLKVAEILVENYQVAVNPEFYPPCLTMHALPQVRQAADDLARLAENILDECVGYLGAAPPSPDMHPWNVSARGVLEMIVTGWSQALDTLSAWEATAPPVYTGALRSLLSVFSRSLASFRPAKETLDTEFLQAGGLPTLGGGIEFHSAVTSFVVSGYSHESLGPQLREGRRLLENTRACLGFLGQKLTAEVGTTTAAPRPKVTYRQQDYYLLDVGKIESSFAEDTQVLYFRELDTSSIRAVLFVLRNNTSPDIDQRNTRLKGAINDDRPLYSPDLQPDFQERPGQIFILMEVEPGKRDLVEYITLRSACLVDLEDLLKHQETDIRVYYL